MHIGVSTYVNPDDGGIAQYALMTFNAMRRRPDDFTGDRLSLFGTPGAHAGAARYEARFDHLGETPPQTAWIEAARRMLGGTRLRRIASKAYHTLRPRRRLDPRAMARPGHVASWLRAQGVELLFSPVTSRFVVESGLPYVLSVHDVHHLLQPHFPEYGDGNWEWIEYVTGNAARSATLIIAESEIGKADLLDCYASSGLTEDRIAVVPYTYPPHLRVDHRTEEAERVRAAYALPERFLFYPAVILPHKNHARLVEALGLLRMRAGLRIPLVLSGAHAEPLAERTWEALLQTARAAGVSDQLHYVGRVPDDDMTGLYASATALVMPTFFGPSNIPLIEAWALGCPVITSSLRGLREMCGDAALLVGAGSAESLASAIHDLWTDERQREELIVRGHARAAVFSPDAFRDAFWSALRTAKARVTAAR